MYFKVRKKNASLESPLPTLMASSERLSESDSWPEEFLQTIAARIEYYTLRGLAQRMPQIGVQGMTNLAFMFHICTFLSTMIQLLDDHSSSPS